MEYYVELRYGPNTIYAGQLEYPIQVYSIYNSFIISDMCLYYETFPDGGGGDPYSNVADVAFENNKKTTYLQTPFLQDGHSSYEYRFKSATYYAIGVGEEDTTLRDSLANILGDKGVEVSPEDDMATLIGKVDGIQGSSLDIISATELPATGKQNQICVITDIEPTSYVLTSNFDDRYTNTSIVSLYTSSFVGDDIATGKLVPITNGKLTTMHYFCKVCQGDKRLASYIYQNGAWTQLTEAYHPLLERGVATVTSYSGGWNAGITAACYTEGTGLYFNPGPTSGSASNCYLSTNNPIDMSLFTKAKITLYASQTHASYKYAIAVAGSTSECTGSKGDISPGNAANTKGNFKSLDNILLNTTPRTIELDISNVKGNTYFTICVYAASASGTHVYITDIEIS